MPVAADKTVLIACSSNWFDTSSAVTAAKPLLVALVVTVPADLPVSEEEEEGRLGDLVLIVVVVVVIRTFSYVFFLSAETAPLLVTDLWITFPFPPRIVLLTL